MQQDVIVGGIEKKWHLLYTSGPYNMETNFNPQEWSWSETECEDVEDVEDSQDQNDPLVTLGEEGVTS